MRLATPPFCLVCLHSLERCPATAWPCDVGEVCGRYESGCESKKQTIPDLGLLLYIYIYIRIIIGNPASVNMKVP